ncbi:MAG: type 2 isopentenyl-diphosphate Delta-isomerase [Candidatus Hodarchaeales archaeon]
MTKITNELSKTFKEPGETADRKLDHIQICLEENVNAQVSTGVEDVSLIHMAAPEIALKNVDLSMQLFGKKIELPLVIAAMTGGHPNTGKINSVIAKVAEEAKIGFGLGSQRAGIENSEHRWTYETARENAPSIPIIGNLGAPQFNLGYGAEEASEAVRMIDADALAIHFNPLQETVQPEGETDFSNLLEKMADIQKTLPVPLILKEVGSGVSGEIASKAEKLEILGIDLGGLGGTSWAAVEALRAKKQGNEDAFLLGRQFWNWGIPTAFSLVECRSNFTGTIIATGGVRTGLEAAKLLAMGADAVGIALPILKEATIGVEAIRAFIENFKRELRAAMFLVGAQNLEALRKVPVVITGRMRSWLLARGFQEYQLNACVFREPFAHSMPRDRKMPTFDFF